MHTLFYKNLFFLVLVTAFAAGVQAQQFKIAKADISFEFVSKEVKGTLAGFKSESVIDWNAPENSIIEGSVASETLDTDNGLRNWSLKSGKYFDADDYPRIYFKSTEIRVTEGGAMVKGALTIKAISKPLTIVFTKEGNSLIGKASLYTTDFDIKIKKNREDNLVKVAFNFSLTEQ